MRAEERRDWWIIFGALFVIMILAIHAMERERIKHMKEYHPEWYEEMIEEGPEPYEEPWGAY